MSPSGGRPVGVALNRPIWSTFTYMLPASMDGGSLEGCRVAVPFGRDRLVGYVWDTNPGAGPEGVEVREVLERLDSAPLLPPDVLRLVRWASSYYRSPPGMMMAAAHPPGLSGRAIRMVRALGRPPGDSPLHAALVPGRALAVRTLVGPDCDADSVGASLARLEAEGIVETWFESDSMPRPRKVRMVEPRRSPEQLVKLAEGMRRRAPRQAEILVTLAGVDGPVERGDLLAAAGARASSLRSLLDRGVIGERLAPAPAGRRERQGSLVDRESASSPPALTPRQREVLSELGDGAPPPGTYLLHGVTGSGKTEVYLRVIAQALERGLSALVMIPEISLTPLTVSRFEARFPGKVGVLHSAMSPGERLTGWNMARNGRSRVVVGPRSAVFAPLPDLGVIVVDEEHDGSYKQSELPHYHGRDTAVMRGAMSRIPVILGSASPSMESYGNAVSGRYRLLELPERVDSRPMPVPVLVETGISERRILSDRLLEGIGRRTARGEQCIILVNRRGFSPTQVCRSCGHRETCPRCGITPTYHRRGEVLRCHHCGWWKRALSLCPECGHDCFAHLGPGIQKVEGELASLLPDTRVMRMDSDTTSGRSSHWDILERFAGGNADVLLGTQMVAKGHDFQGVTLVGMVAADMGLAFPDLRAAERTFQLVLQVAGRAGRGDRPGEVVIQAADTSDQVIGAAARGDYRAFWESESAVRRLFGYPPFGHMVRFLWTGLEERAVAVAAASTCSGAEVGGVVMSGPDSAPIPRINRRYRWASLARSGSRRALSSLCDMMLERFEGLEKKRGVRMDIDVDPMDLL